MVEMGTGYRNVKITEVVIVRHGVDARNSW